MTPSTTLSPQKNDLRDLEQRRALRFEQIDRRIDPWAG
jgi:hypothetical protein